MKFGELDRTDNRTDNHTDNRTDNHINNHQFGKMEPEPVETKHSWFSKSLTKPAVCGYCGKIIIGFKDAAACCGDCRYFSHSECKDLVEKNVPCRITVLHDENIEGHENVLHHHWIKGNVTHTIENAKCVVCKKSLTSDGKLHDVRCTLCEKTICDPCLSSQAEDLYNQVCDLGELSPLKVSPLYGLPERFHEMPNNPLIVFVNRNSGGKQGETILRRVRQCLFPNQVFDLIQDGGATRGLQMFGNIPIRILVAGGDGTVNWVLTDMEKLGMNHPVAVLPLGTGNDTSRFLGWGPGYNGENIYPILKEIMMGVVTPLDRWTFESFNMDDESLGIVQYINNYFSVGVDAKMLTDFHNKREANQNLFTSRKVNKLWYGMFGLKAIFNGCPGLSDRVKIEVDGNPVEVNKNSQAIILVNGPSYAAGTDLWKKGETSQYFDDGKMELVTARGIRHLAATKMNTESPYCVVHGSEFKFTFETDENIPVQIDGEPFEHGKGYVMIRHFGRANMIARNNPDILAYSKTHSVEDQSVDQSVEDKSVDQSVEDQTVEEHYV